jgi:hypothetical protein
MQLNLVYNREGVTDADYCTRTLQFEMITPNSIKPFKTNLHERQSIVDKHDSVVNRNPIGGGRVE